MGSRGGVNPPLNVALLVDTTASMNNTDSDCGSQTRIACAMTAAQTLLQGLSPCASSLSSCGSDTGNSSGGGANVPNPVDKVSLFTFPATTTASAPSDYTCKGQVSVQPYTFAGSSPGYFQPATNTYQIVNWSSDYRGSDASTSLNSQSNVVQAVGATSSSSGCMQAVGGAGTYYAQAIYQAQAALATEKGSSTTIQNVLIVLSDGDANSTHLTAAKAAQAAGTLVYTIAYGAASSGCSTDGGAVTPCTTMQQMASGANYFFSDSTADENKSQCVSASRPITGLNNIFQQVIGDLTQARLIPSTTQ